jgi:hypothetical protein
MPVKTRWPKMNIHTLVLRITVTKAMTLSFNDPRYEGTFRNRLILTDRDLSDF